MGPTFVICLNKNIVVRRMHERGLIVAMNEFFYLIFSFVIYFADTATTTTNN